MLTTSFAIDLGVKVRDLKTDCLKGYAELTMADGSQAAQKLELLLRTLSEVGLQTEVRQGDESTLLVFARATKKSVQRAVYQSR